MPGDAHVVPLTSHFLLDMQSYIASTTEIKAQVAFRFNLNMLQNGDNERSNHDDPELE